MRQGDVVHFLHTDHLGSTSLTTDATGAPIAQTRYLPYGEQRWQNGDPPTGFTFTGQRAEPSFGLLDYNARYYDSGSGRFISPDTIVPEPGNPQSLNRYSYVYGNPVGNTDPTGYCKPEECPWALTQELVDEYATSQGMDRYRNGAALQVALKQDPTLTNIEIPNVESVRAGINFEMTMVLLKEGPSDILADETLELIAESGGSLASGGGFSKAAAGAGLVGGLGSRRNAYSVAYEVELPGDAYPGRSRGHHNQIANETLLNAIDSDPEFADSIKSLIPNFREELVGPRGGISRQPPSNWTWHHDPSNRGVLQLVPRSQHESPDFQHLLHPDGRGGYAIWGR